MLPGLIAHEHNVSKVALPGFSLWLQLSSGVCRAAITYLLQGLRAALFASYMQFSLPAPAGRMHPCPHASPAYKPCCSTAQAERAAHCPSAGASA